MTDIKDFGYQVRQLDEMLRANGLSTRLVIVDDSKTEDEIRSDLVANLKRHGDYVIATLAPSSILSTAPPPLASRVAGEEPDHLGRHLGAGVVVR